MKELVDLQASLAAVCNWMRLDDFHAGHPMIRMREAVGALILKLQKSDFGEATVELEDSFIWFAAALHWPDEPHNRVGQKGQLYFIPHEDETKVE